MNSIIRLVTSEVVAPLASRVIADMAVAQLGELLGKLDHPAAQLTSRICSEYDAEQPGARVCDLAHATAVPVEEVVRDVMALF